MATRQIKKTTNASFENKNVDVENNEENVEVVREKVKKKFAATDTIPCESITSGELGVIGIKSNINYRWTNRGDVTFVEFQDLSAGIMSGQDAIMRPRFIIRDNDFISQFPQLDNVYKSLYTTRDLKDILKLSPTQMENEINSLPNGVKESICGLAATMIENGQLDSVKTIKKLDEIFNKDFSLIADM